MIVDKLKERLSNQFIRNAGWLGLAELVNRVFRLGTTVVLARLFSPYDYGLLAILYMIHSFAEVFTSKIGMGAKIVQTEKDYLEATCDTVYWITWILCISVFLLQCVASVPIAVLSKDQQLILPICIVGLKYLIMPTFKVQSSLIKRENRLKIHAIANVVDALMSNLITMGLALVGMGIWSVVWAMIVSTGLRGMIYCIYCRWAAPKRFKLKYWQEVIHFGSSMLGVNLLDQFRANLDYLIVGRFLGVEALGLYFFAFNAGIGISQNVINMLMASLFPHLCEVRENLTQLKQRYLSSMKAIAVVVIPLVVLQSSLAPVYVPIVFGEKWVDGIPILSIICLSAIPVSFALASYELLNAVGKVTITLIWNSIYTIFFAIALLIAVQWGILSVALSVLICQGLTLIFSAWATHYVFHQSYQTTE